MNKWTTLTSRGLLSVKGADAAKFLQGLTTNQMFKIERGGDSIFTAFLSAQGRVVADAFVHPRNNHNSNTNTNTNTNNSHEFLIDVDIRLAAPLLAHLRKYALRSKVSLADASDKLQVRQVWGPDAKLLWRGGFVAGNANNSTLPPGTVLPKDRWADVGGVDPRNTELGLRYIAPIIPDHAMPEPTLPASFTKVAESEYLIHRMLNGIPEGADDIFSGVSLPLESNFDLMAGVDFRKGCYLGQELTIRTYHIGVTRKRIVPVQIYLAGDPAPTQLVLDKTFAQQLPASTAEIRAMNKLDRTIAKREVGKFCSGIHNIGLALMRLEQTAHSEDTDLILSENLRVRAFPPSWFSKPEE